MSGFKCTLIPPFRGPRTITSSHFGQSIKEDEKVRKNVSKKFKVKISKIFQFSKILKTLFLVVGKKHKNAKFDAFQDLFKSPIMFEIIGSHCTESTNRMSAMWQRLRATNQDEIRSKSILDSNSLISSAEDMVRLGTWTVNSLSDDLQFYLVFYF